jgi:hypothetical protein
MKRFTQSLLFFALLAFIASSCVSTKKLTYLQDKEGEPLEVDTAGYQKLRRTFYKVQVNDLLSVQFKSFNEEVDKFFNLQAKSRKPWWGWPVLVAVVVEMPCCILMVIL